MSQGWPVLLITGTMSVAAIIWIAHCAVDTQAMLASHGEEDWLIDAFVWINRVLTGKPARKAKATADQPPQT